MKPAFIILKPIDNDGIIATVSGFWYVVEEIETEIILALTPDSEKAIVCPKSDVVSISYC